MDSIELTKKIIREDYHTPFSLEEYENFLQRGADPNYISETGENLMFYAFDNVERMKLLLKYGANPSLEIEGIPIPHEILYSRREPYLGDYYEKAIETFELLLNFLDKETINTVDKKGNTLLDIVISIQKPFYIQDLIIAKGGIAVSQERLFKSKRYQKKYKKRNSL